MGLQIGEAVHDVHAGLLQPRRPVDVAALVETGLELDQDGDLLPALGGVDQAIDDRRIAPDPVERNLDGDDLRVVDRGIEEGLDRPKRIEGMMDQDVAGP